MQYRQLWRPSYLSVVKMIAKGGNLNLFFIYCINTPSLIEGSNSCIRGLVVTAPYHESPDRRERGGIPRFESLGLQDRSFVGQVRSCCLRQDSDTGLSFCHFCFLISFCYTCSCLDMPIFSMGLMALSEFGVMMGRLLHFLTYGRIG